ncbi:MAG TPA: hypothetical protein PKL73_17275, partial [Polyangiaceae bacterium]|nr:hypothetical protein [Polyangiaceae bacterium]
TFEGALPEAFLSFFAGGLGDAVLTVFMTFFVAFLEVLAVFLTAFPEGLMAAFFEDFVSFFEVLEGAFFAIERARCLEPFPVFFRALLAAMSVAVPSVRGRLRRCVPYCCSLGSANRLKP